MGVCGYVVVVLSFDFGSVFECSECLEFTLLETRMKEVTDIFVGISDFNRLRLLLGILLGCDEE